MKNVLFLAGLKVVIGLFVSIATANAADSCALTATPHTQSVGVSAATNADEYRSDAARHIYDSYAPCVLHGRLPPLIHAIVLIQLAVGRDGIVRHVNFVRVPSEMPNAMDLVDSMIQRISPFPAATDANVEELRFNEVWLFDENGRFQLGALTEGP
jgi:periplasmic protein TonB